MMVIYRGGAMPVGPQASPFEGHTPSKGGEAVPIKHTEDEVAYHVSEANEALILSAIDTVKARLEAIFRTRSQKEESHKARILALSVLYGLSRSTTGQNGRRTLLALDSVSPLPGKLKAPKTANLGKIRNAFLAELQASVRTLIEKHCLPADREVDPKICL